MTNLKSRTQAAARKRRQRARQRKDGWHRIEIALSDKEYEALNYLCVQCNPGRPPYDRNEFISLLLLCHLERLKRQQAKLGTCEHCKAQMPNHCEGVFMGQSNCWLTRDARKLNLTTVTGHANIEEDN
ncbi:MULTISPECIES: hypothetical protein [Providencia]|uniref:hypothetical protein n=1 Tax=Providencia TaxID=586 RepID=UPI0003E2A19F|nr:MULTISPECIES: hypothetical protein [Providencia]ETS98835.1 hypothetical protein HMPREF1568_3125 [Providencia alcalifaciens PAL-3]ETT05549.1 hypothetical protein HMPREF1562_1970 [Providencia alcalifaciens F90-2004]EUC99349.1 hypothetical protein HMPREF1566_0546 [Providencia alcalifaciens PAL-1]MTC21307.1 hypothetical protein [Providencia sp. wls1938]MTC22158.1 hypothetical protein [Providencia sp. wls1938]